MTIRSRKDWDEYLQEHLCKIPPSPSTSIVIKEVIESPVDSGVLAPKKGQAIPAIEGFIPLVLAHLQDLSKREPLLSPPFEVSIL